MSSVLAFVKDIVCLRKRMDKLFFDLQGETYGRLAFRTEKQVNRRVYRVQVDINELRERG